MILATTEAFKRRSSMMGLLAVTEPRSVLHEPREHSGVRRHSDAESCLQIQAQGTNLAGDRLDRTFCAAQAATRLHRR
eukprot:12048807-Heterocapsa_arctica.AAC.1